MPPPPILIDLTKESSKEDADLIRKSSLDRKPADVVVPSSLPTPPRKRKAVNAAAVGASLSSSPTCVKDVINLVDDDKEEEEVEEEEKPKKSKTVSALKKKTSLLAPQQVTVSYCAATTAAALSNTASSLDIITPVSDFLALLTMTKIKSKENSKRKKHRQMAHSKTQNPKKKQALGR